MHCSKLHAVTLRQCRWNEWLKHACALMMENTMMEDISCILLPSGQERVSPPSTLQKAISPRDTISHEASVPSKTVKSVWKDAGWVWSFVVTFKKALKWTAVWFCIGSEHTHYCNLLVLQLWLCLDLNKCVAHVKNNIVILNLNLLPGCFSHFVKYVGCRLFLLLI